jgi:hypothetical protein
MQITSEQLLTFVPAADIHKTGMHSMKRVHKIVADFYCTRMTNRNLCPQECSQCKLFLDTIAEIDPKKAKMPYALLTWIMKNQVAKAAETASVKREFVAPVNSLNEKVEVDVMDVLMGQFA